MATAFGMKLRELRNQRGLSLRALAEFSATSASHLSDLENERRQPSISTARHLDHVLGAHGGLLDALHTPEGEDMRRRTILGLTTLAAGTALTAPMICHEATRQSLDLASGDFPGVDEWDEIVADYAASYHITPPGNLVCDLTADIGVLQQVIDAGQGNRDLQRIASQLSVLMALALGSAGQPRYARRWWGTARRAAERSGDLSTVAWSRGQEVVRALYERRPPSMVIELADEALARELPSGKGKVSLVAGRAQALSMLGQGDKARSALTDLGDVCAKLPSSVTTDDGLWGWPEYCLWHTRSYVYTHLGDTAAAYDAQDRALALYPREHYRQAAMVRLHGARCQVIDGCLADGLTMGVNTLDSLDASYRTGPLGELGQAVLTALPASERSRPAADELRQRLVASTTTIV